jgi:hypothetical protein
VSADCCPGLPCVTPPGSTKGTCGGGTTTTSDAGTPVTDGGTTTGTDASVGCALYGQTCATTSDCCGDVPCDLKEKRCVYPIY